jgi:3-oxoacyl-(acyl-carrier-protein) synthase
MAFISGIGAISPQHSFGNSPFELVQSLDNFSCIEPDYSDWINPRAIRRMSKVIRMSVATAALALKEAGIEKPDAIIAGTGLGCVTDTTQFLTKLIENNEEALNPTPFIQSTHNTMASQIALLLQCLGYNQTFSQRGFSFEYALQDALMMLKENSEQHILVGGVDESTDTTMIFFNRNGMSVKHGEGSAFFVLNNSRDNAWAEFCGLKTIYRPQGLKEVIDSLGNFLKEMATPLGEIDLVLVGASGNEGYDKVMRDAINALSLKSMQANFKDLCGEYSTATSFALWFATMAIKKGFVPGHSSAQSIKSVLIYNQYFNQHHSLILLKAC